AYQKLGETASLVFLAQSCQSSPHFNIPGCAGLLLARGSFFLESPLFAWQPHGDNTTPGITPAHNPYKITKCCFHSSVFVQNNKLHLTC
uniref:Uncharacterized protein n=1 Tax=Lates calcarifer TaxID=8187 RepID=A0A4W6E3Q9_LATCA